MSPRSNADSPQEELDQNFRLEYRHRVLGALSDTVIFKVRLPVIVVAGRQQLVYQYSWRMRLTTRVDRMTVGPVAASDVMKWKVSEMKS